MKADEAAAQQTCDFLHPNVIFYTGKRRRFLIDSFTTIVNYHVQESFFRKARAASAAQPVVGLLLLRSAGKKLNQGDR
jgi:hypothetical protein